MIQVRRTAEQDPLIFEVVVREGKGETRTPERCVEAAFRFLLDREPKASRCRKRCANG